MIACKYCIATKGLKLSDDHIFETEEELFEHIEMVHDMPVERPGETEEETTKRFKAKNPRAGGPNCQCPSCLASKGEPRLALVDKIIGGD